MKKKMSNFLDEKKAALGTRPYLVNIMIIVFVTICLISFVIFYLQTNNPTSELLTNSSYGLANAVTSLNSTMNGFVERANNATASLSSANPQPLTFVFLIFEQAFYIPMGFLKGAVAVFNLLVEIIFPQLGGTGMGAMLALLGMLIISIGMVTIVFLLIKSARTGESER